MITEIALEDPAMHRSPGTAPPRSFTTGTLLASALPLALLLAAGCGAGGPTPRACADDAGCPSGARCVSSACVANAPPVAAIADPGAPAAYALVSLDGSGSADPDAGDAAVSFAWTVSSIDAPCEPPIIAGTGPLARVRFGCPGRHAVQLVVTDRMGVPSAAAVREVVVAPAAASALTIGPDVVTGHRCAGSPPLCTPDAPITASARAAPAGAGAVRYRWTVVPPPDLALAADRRATLEPGPDAASPTLKLETDGGAISGDWILAVEALDDAGVLGAGAVRVSVGNQPPVVTASDSAPVDHTFVAAESAFVASGAIAVSVADPDGDPVERTVAFRHSGDGAGTFDGADGGAALTFQVRVPYAAPADALGLIGGEGLERTVELLVRDVNGGQALRSFPVVVGDRPPVEASIATDIPVAHSYDAAAQRYRATKVMSRWSDPDGDPLFQAQPTGDPQCAGLSLLGDGTAMVECGLPFTGTPTLAEFATAHGVQQVIADPWITASSLGPYGVHIANQAPTSGSTSSTVSVSCTSDRLSGICCHYVGDLCVSFPQVIPAVTYEFTPVASDLDGDPLEVRLATGTLPTSEVCIPGQCGRVTRTLPMVSACGAVPTGETTSYTVTDGLASATGSHTVTRVCK